MANTLRQIWYSPEEKMIFVTSKPAIPCTEVKFDSKEDCFQFILQLIEEGYFVSE